MALQSFQKGQSEMRRINYYSMRGTVLLLISAIIPGAVLAQSVAEQKFQELLTENIEQIQIEVSTAYTNVKGDEPYISMKRTGVNMWDVSMRGGIYVDGGFSYRWSIAKLENKRTSFVINSYSHPIYEFMVQQVIDHDEIKTITEYTADKVPSLVMNIQKEGNRIHYTGRYTYTGDQKELQANLYHALNVARGLIDQAMKAEEELTEDAREKYSDMKLTPLNNDELIFLLEDYSLFDAEDAPGKYVGSWSFENNENPYSIVNYKDKIDLSVSGYAFETTPEQRKEIFSKMQAYVQDHPLDGAGKTVVEWDPDDEDQETLIIHFYFPYDGTVRGSDVAEAYQDLCPDYGDAFSEKLEETVEKVKGE